MKLTSPVALLVLLVLAGCGGGNDSFTEDYNEAVEAAGRAQDRRGVEPAGIRPPRGADRQTRQNLADLDPPDDAQDEMDKLLAGLDRVTQRPDARSRTRCGRRIPTQQANAAKQLVESSAEVQQAETALQQAVEG